jgi:hypothetical protein
MVLAPVMTTMDLLVGALSSVALRIDSGIVLSYVRCPARVQCKDIDEDAYVDQDSQVVLEIPAVRKKSP